jgi:hypothetical protein
MWDSFGDPVAILFDAERFDQHTEDAQLSYEHSVYKMFFHGGELEVLARLLSWQLVTPCTAFFPEGIIKFIMKIRSSGDMNTGLGTVLIACSLVHSFCVEYQVEYRLFNNGDDCGIICDRKELEVVQKWLRPYCMTAGYSFIVEEPVYQFEKIEFCQAHPLYTERGWTMVRKFPDSLSKDCVSLLPLNTEAAWKRWANDVGNAGMALNAGVPIMYNFYLLLQRLGDGTHGDHPVNKGTGSWYLKQGLKSDPVPISDVARISFWEAFGYPPSYQRLVERELSEAMIDFKCSREGYTIIPQQTTSKLTHYLYNKLFDYINTD